MGRFRKKPVVVEAMQFNGHNRMEIEHWAGLTNVFASLVLEPTKDNPSGSYLQIKTLEGIMAAIPGDWIIRGVNGEFYPCKPDIFAKTHEPADAEFHTLAVLSETGGEQEATDE